MSLNKIKVIIFACSFICLALGIIIKIVGWYSDTWIAKIDEKRSDQKSVLFFLSGYDVIYTSLSTGEEKSREFYSFPAAECYILNHPDFGPPCDEFCKSRCSFRSIVSTINILNYFFLTIIVLIFVGQIISGILIKKSKSLNISDNANPGTNTYVAGTAFHFMLIMEVIMWIMIIVSFLGGCLMLIFTIISLYMWNNNYIFDESKSYPSTKKVHFIPFIAIINSLISLFIFSLIVFQYRILKFTDKSNISDTHNKVDEVTNNEYNRI